PHVRRRVARHFEGTAPPIPSSLPLCSFFFFFNDTATTEIYTLSLPDALPISDRLTKPRSGTVIASSPVSPPRSRSEEHTSELQSPVHLVCRLLLEKKKNNIKPKLPPKRTSKASRLFTRPPRADENLTMLKCHDVGWPHSALYFFLMTRHPPRSKLFPYTTPFA